MGAPVGKMGAPVGNPSFIAGIEPIHYVIMLKGLNFPEILDETPEFWRKFGDLGIS